MKKNKQVIEIQKKIVAIKITESSVIGDLFAEFYNIMREYDIRQGVEKKNGSILYDTPEWSMYMIYFLNRVNNGLSLLSILGEGTNDLSYYPYKK